MTHWEPFEVSCIDIQSYISAAVEVLKFNVYLKLKNFSVGHILQSLNGIKVTGSQLDDGRNAMEVINDPKNYPINLKFMRPRLSTNEKIFQVYNIFLVILILIKFLLTLFQNIFKIIN